jgi:hypothetical protein
MSKYQLENLLNEITGTGRIGTFLASYRYLIDRIEDLKDMGVEVKELGMSGDGKTAFEFEIYPEDSEPFSVYPYKFDPSNEGDEFEEVPFSIGGKPEAMKAAKKLLGQGAFTNQEYRSLAEDDSVEENKEKMEEEKEVNEVTMANVNVDEVKFHLDAYEAGTIDGDDLHQAISEIFFGKVAAPGMNSDEDFEREQRMQMSMREEDSIDEAMMPRPSLFKGTEAEIKAYHDSLKRELDKDKEKFKKDYMDFSDDDWREDFENYVADKALQEHFGRFMKDYQ